ncbi:MAG: two-component sensor histidine kinase, partial [Clostridiales bacterium]|nr:two-component sensor histidine kinase [Clostridiales bacterium]
MKIKTKLAISFCIIIFVPLLLAIIVGVMFLNVQVQVIRQTYGIKNPNVYGLSSTVQMLSSYTASDFEELQGVARQTPQKFQESDYLDAVNDELEGKYSYLVVRLDGQITYNGSSDNSTVIDSLPEYGTTEPDSGTGIYIDGSKEVLIKQVDFRSEGDEPESAFIVTAIT